MELILMGRIFSRRSISAASLNSIQFLLRLAVDVHEEDHRIPLSRVDNSMRNVGAVAGGIAGVQDFGIVGGFDANLAFLNSEEFAGAREMGRAAQGAAGFQRDLIEFDVFFEVQRGKGADLAMGVGAIVVSVVVGANDVNGGGGIGRFKEFAEVETEGAGDAEGNGERGIGLFAFDLAEHRTADAAGVGKGFQRPAALGPEAVDAVAEVAVDGFWFRRPLYGCSFHVRYSGETSCIADFRMFSISGI